MILARIPAFGGVWAPEHTFRWPAGESAIAGCPSPTYSSRAFHDPAQIDATDIAHHVADPIRHEAVLDGSRACSHTDFPTLERMNAARHRGSASPHDLHSMRIHH